MSNWKISLFVEAERVTAGSWGGESVSKMESEFADENWKRDAPVLLHGESGDYELTLNFRKD